VTIFYLEVDGLSLKLDGAWQIDRSLSRLKGGPPKRGQNTIVPGVAGRLDNPKRLDEGVYDLVMLVKGRKDRLGAPYADEVAGKILNLDYLETRLYEPTGTLAAVLYMPDASTQTGDVQFDNWTVAKDEGAVATVTFDLIVPAGRVT